MYVKEWHKADQGLAKEVAYYSTPGLYMQNKSQRKLAIEEVLQGMSERMCKHRI